MFDLFVDFFIILFVVVDPVGLAPIFAALTHGDTPAERRKTALKGTVIAGMIMLVFALFGDGLLRALGIGMPAFQMAGGALLFLLAVEMVFARHSGLRSTTDREQKEAEHKKDISVFPLAVPLIAGPGALTTVLLMVGRHDGDWRIMTIVLAVALLVLLVTLISLLFAARIMKVLGETGANVVTRVLGIVLAALAVQFILDGVQAGFDLIEQPELPTHQMVSAG
ncbi:MAG: MarC family transcriptional regulator [Candidatus Muproteobacteria bacterium RIFCSPHIGHO2_01_FULL_65_16]|uniref:UPF0056 membrane protein n=1 Tax=Candidatus Muproteobacteria bacterium RIFCSPHIGHO2_01_FULL_65_16 TaxID=1817764 RepID=A0A1F6TL86_9PROT|nr:MAG: MarC family transcriptional regulator [Candidatus Muproteobacteria bacterium RIFCSPHIGHO2_01_FULL_65_16]